MLAHELRNPLAPIRNASELLSRKIGADAGLQPIVSIVQRQAAQLSRLVDDLLDISRISQGRIQLHRAPVDIVRTIELALESVEPLMRQRQHTVRCEIASDRLHTEGDGVRLVQCVTNVLNNAAKYTDVGGEIHVVLREEPSFAVIEITDNGLGISPELLPAVFDMFVQSERSLDRSLGGLGIGLSVVRRLIEMHGGTVSAHSAGIGYGSTFALRLPLAHAIALAEPENVAGVGQARRVLAVDDNVDAAASLKLLLELDGHVVQSVHGSREALQSFAMFDPDIVILDIGLPEMNGYELAERIRAQDDDVTLIALTGYGQPEDVSRALESGFDVHLVKPVDLSALRIALSA